MARFCTNLKNILLTGIACVALTAFIFGSQLTQTVSAQGTLDMPIVEKPYEHEAKQFGYKPWYIPNTPAFDSLNRPYIRSRATDPHMTGYIQTLRNGKWVRREFISAVRSAFPDFARFQYGGGTLGAVITFDNDDHLYTLVQIKLKDESEHDLLIYSADFGETFQVYELPKDEPARSRPIGFANIEQRVGHNVLNRPPLLATLSKRADNPIGKWTAHYNLHVIQPRKENGKLVLSEPVLVTDHGLYMSRHAGNPSFAVSGPDKTYITWAETTDHPYYPGTPTFVATFDPETLTITDRQFCGYGYPVNDGHNTPGIVMDHQGYLHVLTGSHGENFWYSKSKTPNSTADGMTEPIRSLKTGWKEFGAERGRQCYLSFVCTEDGSLHTVFRQWIQGTTQYFEGSHFAGLAYHKKAVEQPWAKRSNLLVVPPLDDYSIYYQSMAVDRKDRIYVSYGYRSVHKHYGTGEAENHYMAILMSEDQGRTWKLATTVEFVEGMFDFAGEDKSLTPATLRGVVSDSHGSPVVGAAVRAGQEEAVTDSDGQFTFENVLAQEVELTVQVAGYEEKHVRVVGEGAELPEARITLSSKAAQ